MKMKELFIPFLAMLTLAFFATTGNAGDLYGGVQYSQVDYSESVADLDFTTVSVIAGYELSNSVALEARYGQGQGDDEAYDVDVEVDSVYGLYGVLSLPNETNVEPYFIIGYTKGKLTASGYW